MIREGWFQLGTICLAILILSPFLGKYIYKVFSGEKMRSDFLFNGIEKTIYKVGGIDKTKEQRWQAYAKSVVAFSVVSIGGLYAILRLQEHLPLNPNHIKGVSPALAFNTAISFVTNTNWQNYLGEQSMSHFSQMVGLTTQNFLSAAVGLAVVVALIRGLLRESSETIGNFWVDLIRGITRILLPLALIFAVVFVSQGVVQNFNQDKKITTLAGVTQKIPGGLVASQESIKEIGTNGGGFYNANSAHPFENPNSLTNLLQIFLLLIIPFSLAASIAYFTKQKKHYYHSRFRFWHDRTLSV